MVLLYILRREESAMVLFSIEEQTNLSMRAMVQEQNESWIKKVARHHSPTLHDTLRARPWHWQHTQASSPTLAPGASVIGAGDMCVFNVQAGSVRRGYTRLDGWVLPPVFRAFLS
jgi:hypothetical protein